MSDAVSHDRSTAFMIDPLLARRVEAAPPDRGLASRSKDRPPRRRRTGAARRVLRHPLLRATALTVAVLLLGVGYSYAGALTGPGSDSLQARTVEWARDHHLGTVVDRIERFWYDHHQAPLGGQPGQSALPSFSADPVHNATVASASSGASPSSSRVPSTTTVSGPVGSTASGPVGSTSSTVVISTTTPSSSSSVAGDIAVEAPTIVPAVAPTIVPAVTPAVTPDVTTPAQPGITPTSAQVASAPVPLQTPAATPIAGEGQWTPFGPLVNGQVGAYVTDIRPDSVHTSSLDAVVWFDPTIFHFRQYPGTKIPGAPWDRPDHVEADRQSQLFAAFAGGFRLKDSGGGLLLGGQELQPMRVGGATFAIDSNGVPNIGLWGRDIQRSASLDSARQNLDLIVDGGAAVPGLATDSNRSWGFTGPANKSAVWRSGAGITADGQILWVGGPGLSIEALADTLVRAGAIRGMQLEINQEWVQFNTYSTNAAGTTTGKQLLSGMQHTGDRWLAEDTRDFIAVFAPMP
jgi:hypothetical protein